jgi:hypothetical protein
MIWPGPTVWWPIQTDPKCYSKTFITIQDCGVLTQTTLWILTTVSTSNPVPKMIKNWNVYGMSLWENWLKEEQCIYFYIVFNITYFFHQMWILLYIICLKKVGEQTTFNINTHFMIRATYFEFQTSTTIPQENLTSDHEIKQHIWQWKNTKDCSWSDVPCHIHNMNDSRNNIKWSTIISLSCHYVLTFDRLHTQTVVGGQCWGIYWLHIPLACKES